MLHLRQRRDSTPATTKWQNKFDENLEQWPHLNELVHCYTTDWVKDENKYGHYESVGPLSFQNQIYEGPDTDIETEMCLAGARRTKAEDITEDDIPSTSGRQFMEAADADTKHSGVPKHFGQSSLPAYEPAFDWENERSLILGQRIPETPISHGMKISVKVQSLQFQVGLVEPFYGAISLYNRERREKLSEDFYFPILPTEMQDAKSSYGRHGVFYLDAPSASVCLLIQLEKHATEEGGVTPSVYSRKESDLIAGATESSAMTVEWVISELLRKPEIFKKTTEELDRVIGRDRWVEEKDVSNLPYINAIIKETMRLHPVAPMLVPRLAREDVKIVGYDIPKGTQILVNTWTIGRDPTIWQNPNDFKPERFLGKNIDVKGHDYELLPFGSGRRMCPGYPLGIKVIQASLANLLHGFHWRLRDGMKKEDLSMEEIFGLSTPRKLPLEVVVEPKLASHLY